MPLTSEEDKEALMEKHTRLNINKQRKAFSLNFIVLDSMWKKNISALPFRCM